MNQDKHFSELISDLEIKSSVFDTVFNKTNYDHELQNNLSKANISLGRLDANIDLLNDVDATQFMFLLKESLLSVLLDGVKIPFLDGLKYSLLFDEYYHPPDVLIFLNHLKAIKFGLDYINNNEITLELIKELHKILLDGVRIINKYPGEFRRALNVSSTSIGNSTHIHPQDFNLLAELEKFQRFINSDTYVQSLFKAGLIYLLFLKLRPFTTFNGKVGRILTILYLVKQGVLKKPFIFPSEYFNNTKAEYVQCIESAFEKNEVDKWLKFFTNSIIYASDKSSVIIKKIQYQKEIDIKRINGMGRTSKKGMELLLALFRNPLVRVKDVEAITRLKNPNALALISKFVNCGILEEITGQKRNRIFAYKNYIKNYE